MIRWTWVQSLSGDVAVQHDAYSCGVWVMLTAYLAAFVGVTHTRAVLPLFARVIGIVRQLCAKSVVENNVLALELVEHSPSLSLRVAHDVARVVVVGVAVSERRVSVWAHYLRVHQSDGGGVCEGERMR